MINRLAMAAAVGASVFALAGAGAAALNAAGDGNGQVVQQSDALSATCQPGTANYSNVVANQDVTHTRIFQQSIDPQCGGSFVQMTLKMDNGALVYSNKVWVPTSNVTTAAQEAFLLGGSTDLARYGYAVFGIDLNPQFPAGVCAEHVASTVMTIAGQIDSPGTNTAGAVVGSLPSCANDSFYTPAA